nr:hypothetical protein [Kitasatospora aureofaciens]
MGTTSAISPHTSVPKILASGCVASGTKAAVSYAARTREAASVACSMVSATTRAITWPLNLIRSSCNGSRLCGAAPKGNSSAGESGSALWCVSTRRTPGIVSACAVSRAVSVPAGTVLVTCTAWSRPSGRYSAA